MAVIRKKKYNFVQDDDTGDSVSESSSSSLLATGIGLDVNKPIKTIDINIAGSGVTTPTISINGDPLVIVSPDNPGGAQATATDYDRINIVISYRKTTSGPNSLLFLSGGTDITKKNLVGDDGFFNIRVQYLKNSSVWFTSEEATYTGAVVVAEDEYTLDQWISMATGKILDSDGAGWHSPGSGETDPSQNGFYVTFSSGDEGGTNTTGTLRITFKIIAQTANSTYCTAQSYCEVIVNAGWYTDDNGVSIELMPVKAKCDVYASMDGRSWVKAIAKDEYLLVSSALANSAAVLNALTGTNYTRVSNGGSGTDMNTLIDTDSEQYHFFISRTINGSAVETEIFGVLRNALDGWSANEDIPRNGEIELFSDYIPPVDGESNIEVLYPCYVNGNADKIDKCHIAKLFGNANAKNRLFVSGNPDHYNCDWHSSARNNYLESGSEVDSNGDFTYFGDMDYCFYGQTDNAIMGYDNVATDKMIVLKSKSKIEPTNYFRTSSLIQAIDAGGNAVYGIDGSAMYQESFPLATGNIGAGAMNMKSIVNLNGDTLYLSSENTICGLDISGQVGDSQRISYSRSRYIDTELKELNLSEAVLWTDNTSVYLFASEATYVAHYESFNSENAQYEWFKLDVKGVCSAIEIDGYIYFGTNDGKIYRYEKNKFSDCNKLFIASGGILASNDKITYESALSASIDETAKLTFRPKTYVLANSVYRKVCSISNATGNNIDVIVDSAHNTLKIVALGSSGNYNAERHEVLLEELAYGGWFYLDKPNGQSTIQVSTTSTLSTFYLPYKLVPSEDYHNEYEVYDGNGSRVTLSPLAGANLCRLLDGDFDIIDLDKTNSTFKIRENGRNIDLILYADQTELALSFKAEIHMHKAVKSYFIAAPAVLGDISYRKTVWAWTLTAFKEANDLKVCQATNEQNLEDMRAIAFADSVPIGFDYKGLSFKAIDFSKSAVPRKYTYFRPLSVPFMAFGFKSDNDANSILTAASIVYTIPMLGRGDK